MTKPKKKLCPSCQAENSVGRKTCCQCLLILPRKNKLPDNVQMDSWASSAKSYRNGARAINSAQLSVSLNYCNSTKVLACETIT